MGYEKIEKDVKNFILNELKAAKKYPDTALNSRAIAFGALQFASNYLFPSYNYDLANWWEKEIWGQFTNCIKNNT